MNLLAKSAILIALLSAVSSVGGQGAKVTVKVVIKGKTAALELNGKKVAVPPLNDVSVLTKQIEQLRGSQTTVEIVVPDGSSLEPVYAAVKASHDAGFVQIKYSGCIPPGCSILTGATPDQEKLKGEMFKASELLKIVIENSQKC